MRNALSKIFLCLGLIGINMACYCAGYSYARGMCGMQHLGWSASPQVSLLNAVPLVLATIVCFIISGIIKPKPRRLK